MPKFYKTPYKNKALQLAKGRKLDNFFTFSRIREEVGVGKYHQITNDKSRIIISFVNSICESEISGFILLL